MQPLAPGSERLRRHQAYEVIRGKILSGELPPGTALSEADLARDLGISRTPVREALQRLHEDGLASIFPRRGAIVRVLSVHEVGEILQVREALEGLAARLAAARMARPVLDELRAEWRAAAADVSESTTQEMDKRGVEFHAAIVEASGNRILRQMLDGIRGRIEGTRALYLQSTGETALRRVRLVCADHLAILEALEAGDRDAAETRMREHLRQISSETIGAVE